MAKATHRRRIKAQWTKLIEDKQHSPLSIEAYCEQHQISVSNFYVWRARLNKPQASEFAKPPASVEYDWLPIDLSSPVSTTPNWDIELDLPGGMTLRMKTA